MTEHITRVAGIDTGKQKLDVVIHGDEEHWSFENNASGWSVCLPC